MLFYRYTFCQSQERAIQDYVLNDLSKKILAEEVSREKPITIDHTDADGLVFKNQ